MNRLGGGLRAPAANLREPGVRLHYDSKSPTRVEVIVMPDDVLDVPDDVAAQMQAADPHFKTVDDGDDAAAKKTARPAKKAARSKTDTEA